MKDEAPMTRHPTQDFGVLVDDIFSEKGMDDPADRHIRFNCIEEY